MIRLDPRTKIALLLLVVLYSALAESGWTECVVIGVILLTGVLTGRVWKTVRAGVAFALLWLFSVCVLPRLGGVLHTSLLVWLGLVFKCYPSCMLAGVMIGTTHVSEFMAAMAKMKVPKAIVIPLAVMFRYFPAVKEDWQCVRDAMALRGLRLTPAGFLKNPSGVIDALYVPMLVSASKAADEISVAAITRGVENPAPRSSRLEIRFHVWDLLFFCAYVGLVILGMRG